MSGNILVFFVSLDNFGRSGCTAANLTNNVNSVDWKCLGYFYSFKNISFKTIHEDELWNDM